MVRIKSTEGSDPRSCSSRFLDVSFFMFQHRLLSDYRFRREVLIGVGLQGIDEPLRTHAHAHTWIIKSSILFSVCLTLVYTIRATIFAEINNTLCLIPGTYRFQRFKQTHLKKYRS